MLDQGLALADWDGFDARAAEASKARGKLRGRGIATFLEWTGGNVFEERVTVDVPADGFIEIYSATQGMGQGIATSYAQLAVDVFGVPIERIRIVQGDTDRGNGFGSAGSRSLFTGGSAVQVAAAEHGRRRGKDLAAEALEAAPGDIEYRAGRFTRRRHRPAASACSSWRRSSADARIVVDSTSTAGGADLAQRLPRLRGRDRPATPAPSRSWRYASVNDIGRVVNPLIVAARSRAARCRASARRCARRGLRPRERPAADRQLHGLRAAARRRCSAPSTPMRQPMPCRNNLLGVKGVGELGTIGATPAVVNARGRRAGRAPAFGGARRRAADAADQRARVARAGHARLTGTEPGWTQRGAAARADAGRPHRARPGATECRGARLTGH